VETKRQWTLVTALACLAVLVVGYMLTVRPQNSKASSLRSQAATTQSEVQSLRTQLSMLQAESRNEASEQAKLDKIVRQLPPGPQLPTLTRDLDKAARQTNIDLVNLAPGAVAPFQVAVARSTATTAKSTTTGSAAPGVTTGAVTTPSATLETLPLTLTVSGQFFDLERFLDKLEGLQRALLVNGFTVAFQPPSGSAARRPNSGELTVTVQAAVFMTSSPLAGGGVSPAVTGAAH
jgi:Tfp pilus assembly protein PilO